MDSYYQNCFTLNDAIVYIRENLNVLILYEDNRGMRGYICYDGEKFIFKIKKNDG